MKILGEPMSHGCILMVDVFKAYQTNVPNMHTFSLFYEIVQPEMSYHVELQESTNSHDPKTIIKQCTWKK